ncbi:MAG TPA: glycosyltransferase family 4 protein, partial [Gammaproteobacteria bacterium]|nr:glycosyltransferase family 4 protein [Gammaproteobacteria bacterium]
IPPLIPFDDPIEERLALRKQLGLDPGDRIFLFVGALTVIKNPSTVIRAFRKLGYDFIQSKKLKVVFLGDGELMDSLSKEIAADQLENYFLLKGSVARNQVPMYYKAADFYITASDYEGTSIALLEAMFHRLPIIAADAPGLNRMIKHNSNGILFKPKDENSLADAISRLLVDPKFANTLGLQASQDYLQDYSFKAMMTEYEKLFSELIRH